MRTHGHREGSTKHWGLLGGKGRASGRGRWGGIARGEMPNVGEGEKGSKTQPCVYLCNYLACSAHVPQNLKCNKKLKIKKKTHKNFIQQNF